MTPLDLIAIAAGFAGLAGGGFYAGWRSAAAYLSAARSVSDVTGAAVAQVNAASATLDRTESALASLKGALEANTTTLEQRHRSVEEALLALFSGLERAGLARSPEARRAARQVGESTPDS